VLGGVARYKGCPYVFSNDCVTAIGGYGKAKAKPDNACGVTGWTLHDLKKTAWSLKSRAGVPSDHAERCPGHVIGGARGVYDRYEYHAEKKLVYENLAGLIDRIINPVDNATAMGR
jgi:hypothetical protein